MIEIRPVGGGATLAKAVRALRGLDKPLKREVYAALTRSVRPLSAAVKDEARQVMPHRGGYSATLTRSLSVRSARRAATVLRLTVSAKGRSQERDVTSLDRGRLRHPVFGRSRRLRGGRRQPNPWATTRVRAGFVTRPMDRGAPVVRRELVAALDRVMATLP